MIKRTSRGELHGVISGFSDELTLWDEGEPAGVKYMTEWMPCVFSAELSRSGVRLHKDTYHIEKIKTENFDTLNKHNTLSLGENCLDTYKLHDQAAIYFSCFLLHEINCSGWGQDNIHCSQRPGRALEMHTHSYTIPGSNGAL